MHTQVQGNLLFDKAVIIIHCLANIVVSGEVEQVKKKQPQGLIAANESKQSVELSGMGADLFNE